MLEKAIDELAARIFGRLFRADGCARQQHLALDMNEQRRGVDKVAGHIHVAGAEMIDVGQELRGDFGDGNVVDVDVLLANEVKQQVERTIVDLTDENGEGRLLSVLPARLERCSNFFGGGWLNCEWRLGRA